MKFPKLPMNCWGTNTLSKMASTIGNSLFVDTTKQTRVSYARILIEVNVTKKLLTEVTIKDTSGRQFQQHIEFEWRPAFCAECLQIGHDCSKKKKEVRNGPLQRARPKLVQAWKPKAKQQPVEKMQNQQQPLHQSETNERGKQKLETAITETTQAGWTQVRAKGSTSGQKLPEHQSSRQQEITYGQDRQQNATYAAMIVTKNGFQALPAEGLRDENTRPLI